MVIEALPLRPWAGKQRLGKVTRPPSGRERVGIGTSVPRGLPRHPTPSLSTSPQTHNSFQPLPIYPRTLIGKRLPTWLSMWLLGLLQMAKAALDSHKHLCEPWKYSLGAHFCKRSEVKCPLTPISPPQLTGGSLEPPIDWDKKATFLDSPHLPPRDLPPSAFQGQI